MNRRCLLALPALLATRRAVAQPGGLPVVASFSILGDMVAQIGGDRITLRVIAGPDADAHSFQPRPSDVVALRQAGLVLRNGFGFDAWMDRLVGAAGFRGPVATATQGITPRSMAGHDHDHGGAGRRRPHSVGPHSVPDPHAWQDLQLGQLVNIDQVGVKLQDSLVDRASAAQRVSLWENQPPILLPLACSRSMEEANAMAALG